MTNSTDVYHDFYIKGFKFALEMLQLADTKEEGVKQLETILQTLTTKTEE